MEISVGDNQNLEKFIDFALSDTEYECEAVYTNRKKLTSEKFKEIFQYFSSNNNYELINTIDNETLDISIDIQKFRKYRLSLLNNTDIMTYCKTNKLNNVFYGIKQNKKGNNKIEFNDYNFNINLKRDTKIDDDNEIETIDKIIQSAIKTFRFKKRFSFLTKSKYFRIDLTLVKTGNKSKTFFESGILQNRYPKYELEIELNNKDIDKDYNKKDIITELFNIIGNILMVIEDNEYIIKEQIKNSVLSDYLELSYGLKLSSIQKPNNPKKYFIGVQPVTLQKENLLKDSDISIQKDYSVTDKADGERNLLYISNKDGKLYLIDNRLNIKYTGMYCEESDYYNTIIDGEYVTKDRYGSDINNYLAFDIYYSNNKDVSTLPLISDNKSRLGILKEIFNKNNFGSVTNNNFKLEVKEFLTGNDEEIFKKSKEILERENYSYNRDGLIFTPTNLTVGGKNINDKKSNLSTTWYRAFKWKPPEENTIDFLVEFVSDVKYKSFTHKYCKLYVGYNEDIKINITDILNHNFQDQTNGKYEFDECYIEMKDSKILTEEKEEISDNMIVEFRYDKNNDKFLRWIPYRIRYDKTELYRITNDISNTANYLNTAQRVFDTIENPILEENINGNEKITIDIVNKENNDNDIYYMREKNRDDSLTRSLLDFHNYWVKDKFLYSRFAGNNSLFEIACGKGGDLRKWAKSNYKLVIASDISEDNLYNIKDGAYKRYAQLYKKRVIKNNNNILFVQLDASKKWNKEYINSLKNEEMQKLNKIIFGFKDIKDIDKGDGILVKFHNKVSEKFRLVSCMFAIHYMFKDDSTLTNLVNNIDKVLKNGGFFFGTCLDGESVYKKLKGKDEIKAEKNGNLLWRIQKNYKDDEFKENDFLKNYGKEITVYMETINQNIVEYLVDYRLLEYKLREKNILPVNKEDLKNLNLTKSTDSFKFIYDKNIRKIDNDKKMTINLKEYSFLNRWFIFRKY